MKNFLVIVLISWIIFFGLWLGVYKTGINTLAIQSEDTIPTLILPVTAIKEHTFFADTYYKGIIERYPHPDDKNYYKGLVPYYFREVNGHYVSAFPIITGLLAVPVYLIPIIFKVEINWDNLILMSHAASSLIVAFCGGFFYLLAKKFLDYKDSKKAILLTSVYLFGTINFALVSQSLWQHGAAQLFTILSLLFLFRGRGRRIDLFYSGLFLSLGVLSRPTVAVFIPLFILLVIHTYQSNLLAQKILVGNLKSILRMIAPFLVGMFPAVMFFVWYNGVFFENISNQGYSNQLGGSWLTSFPWGFLGLWFSPSKGILVYSPVFVFSIIGTLWLIFKRGLKNNFVNFVFLLTIVTYILVLGTWKHWYGGYSFGYRMASEVLPFLVLLLIPYLKSNLFLKTKYIFYVLFGASIGVELMGVAFFDGIWHGTFDKGFWKQGWLWSIYNSEVVFNITRLLVKLRP